MSLGDVIYKLEMIAEKCRHSDKYFKGENIDVKIMLNDIGKILEEISHLLFIYKYADENRRIEIREMIHNIRIDVFKEVSKERKLQHAKFKYNMFNVCVMPYE